MYELTAAALIAAAVGVLIQFLVEVPGFSAIPPDLIILTVTAVAVYAPLALGDRPRHARQQP